MLPLLVHSKRTCQDNFSPRNSPLISILLLPNWNRLCTNSKNSIADMLVIFISEKGASKYLKMPFYVLESFPIYCVMPMVRVQRDELVTRLSFGETVEFLQAEVFVL